MEILKHFSNKLQKVRQERGMSQGDVAREVNKITGLSFKRNTISNYENGVSSPSLDILKALAKVLDISTDYLLDIGENANTLDSTADNKSYLLNDALVTEKELPQVNEPREPILLYKGTGIPVPITNIRAAAGSGYMNEEYIDKDEVIVMPEHLLKSGTHLCVQIKGNSMTPTLQDSGYIVIRLIEKSECKYMPDERIYVVATTDGQTYLKRVRNRLNQGFLVLTSDNPDKASYPNFNLQHDEIQSVWYAEWYITARMPNIHDQFYSRLTRMEDGIDAMAQELEAVKRRNNLK